MLGIHCWRSQPIGSSELVVVSEAPKENGVALRQIMSNIFFAEQIQHVPLMALKTLDRMGNAP
jgi:hypothetical protein